MPLPTLVLAMALQSPVVTPPEKVESRARPDVPRYTIEQLFATRAIGAAAWAPDGERVALVTNISGRNNLWLVPAAGGWPTQLTTSGQRQTAPAWSPDGRWIAFQSDRNANEQWDLFLVSPASGAVRNLTNTPEVSEEEPLWSPDGRWIAYAVKPRTAPNHEIALYDVARSASRALTKDTPPDLSLQPVAFVPGGKWLLAARSRADGADADAALVDLATGAVRVLTPHTGDQIWYPTDVSHDGARVLLTSDAKNGHLNVALLDVAAALARPAGSTKPLPVTWLTEETWEMQSGNFSPDGRWLTWAANLDGNTDLYSYNPATKRLTRLPVGGGTNAFAGSRSSYSPDGTRLLVRRSAADAPGDLAVYHLDAATTKPITHAFVNGVQAADMVEPWLVRYPSRDGLEISAFLYVPWNLKRDGSHPAIVWVHGGPTAQSTNGFSRQVQYLVNHGYVVLAPNYRGSTGYGRKFQEANRFDMGGGDLADLVAGAELLKRTGFVDPKRIAVGGGSYGGYLTMMALTKTPDAWAAGAALFPFVNWFTEMAHEDPALLRYDLATMGDPKKDEARLRDRSPLFFLDRVRAPLLLAAGGNDPRCPASESQQVVDALKKQGRTCEFLLYPDEGHGFARLENLFDAYTKIVAFLDRELKGAK